MQFCSLYSGSSGNSSLVMEGKTRLLVDCGKSGVQTREALEFAGVSPESLNGILLTHEHSDHVSGVGVMSRRYHIPMYATALTWEAIGGRIGTIDPELKRVFDRGTDFSIGEIGVEPMPVCHDAAEPSGFRLWGGKRSVATVTDLGCVSEDLVSALAGVDLLLLESNHDPDMVRMNPHYTQRLKSRILSRQGHLSNADCAEALVRLMEEGCSHFILGHLSGENNMPELCMETTLTRLELEGAEEGRDVFVDLAWRDRVGSMYELQSEKNRYAV